MAYRFATLILEWCHIPSEFYVLALLYIPTTARHHLQERTPPFVPQMGTPFMRHRECTGSLWQVSNPHALLELHPSLVFYGQFCASSPFSQVTITTLRFAFALLARWI